MKNISTKTIAMLAIIFASSFGIGFSAKCYIDYKHQKNIKRIQFSTSKLAAKYLCGLNGIEIGMSMQNSFQLTNPKVCEKIGGFANIDFSAAQGGLWQVKDLPPAIVNFVATGDILPFKNETLDYVLSSHMIEHAFDPIKTIKEWMRVIKKGGYVFIIAPHKERTFDKNRDETSVQELLDRHSGKLKLSDYVYPKTPEAIDKYFKSINRKQEGESESDIPHLIVKSDKEIPEGWLRFKTDNHHHWSVWKTQGFLDLCKAMNFKVVEYQDKDDKVGNGFTIVIQK